MSKLRICLEIEFDVSTWYDEDEPSEKAWFLNEVLAVGIDEEPNLVLHSNEVGDAVGAVTNILSKEIIE